MKVSIALVSSVFICVHLQLNMFLGLPEFFHNSFIFSFYTMGEYSIRAAMKLQIKEQITSHEEQLISLKKIEGQIRGVQKMIEDKRYCVDILMQLHSVMGAIQRVESGILRKHLEGCVSHALKGSSDSEKQEKVDEVIDLIMKFRKRA
jgi:DNA-binding FrmR family transcriptional regulator